MKARYKATLCPCGRPAVDQFGKGGRCADCKAREDRFNSQQMKRHQPPPSRPGVREYRVFLPRPLREKFGI